MLQALQLTYITVMTVQKKIGKL